MATSDLKTMPFEEQAEQVLALEIAHRVNAVGGYGAGGEVIYDAHPCGCPSALIDQRGQATVAFMSNGSTAFDVKLDEGMDVHVLNGSFHVVEKREIGVPSQNVWLAVEDKQSVRVASLVNPNANAGLQPESVRIVKLGDPNRSMWYIARFAPGDAARIVTVVKLALVYTKKGPALLRETYLKNIGKKAVSCAVWTYFDMHGTQVFVYNRPLWYDHGLPLTKTESVFAASVPYTDILQLKRVSTVLSNAKAVDATCDYSTFVGDTSVFSLMPKAVLNGAMLSGGAGRKLNRFSTSTVAANQFSVQLKPSQSASIRQSLLYVTDARVIRTFNKKAETDQPKFSAIAKAFKDAATYLVGATPGAKAVSSMSDLKPATRSPFFEFYAPAAPVASEYANSVWTGVPELYEKCRAQGATLAQGIELGTRDRAQDMWPKLKEDPGRVRDDLVHALSFLYITQDKPITKTKNLSLPEKLHGMFPRQFPSRWDDRSQEVLNDNRPYTDSPLWLINAIAMYIRETGDTSILSETVKTIRLTNPNDPIHSGIIGNDLEMTILEVILEIFASFKRHCDDSPYGMAQILYGDWCDPVDMFGTSVIGDPTSRGKGTGVQVRLSAHLFECLIQATDLFDSPAVESEVKRLGVVERVAGLKPFANTLRKNIVTWAWEDGGKDFKAGFLNVIHELKRDGTKPNYKKGETGYTLGSMKRRDFDRINRRELGSQAYCIRMLVTHREYLDAIPNADEIIAKTLKTIDTLFFDPKLGLVLYTAPIANNERARKMVGRMGIVPTGCAENGEYHHCQMFMHRFRLDVPRQADKVWKQFKPIMSAMRDESLCGPFETPSTSYASDKADPHFGKGMNFGLSGSVDWIIEVFQTIAGLQLNLHDDNLPDITVKPNLPAEIDKTLTYRRIIHYATAPGKYRRIPFSLSIRKQSGAKARGGEATVTINGKPAARAEIASLKGIKKVDVEIVYP